ncbi:MAG: hypothetical protein WC721_07145 [Victivallaceae bacterium]|jgi:hypothetical protein
MLKIIFCIIATTALCAAVMADAQSRLIAEKIKELDEINRQVIQQLGDLSKYENKTVYVKAKLIPLGDSRFKVKIDQVSTDKIEFGNCAKDEKIIVVKGKVSQDKAKKFTIDLENVLPPPDDTPKDKNSKDNGEKKK